MCCRMLLISWSDRREGLSIVGVGIGFSFCTRLESNCGQSGGGPGERPRSTKDFANRSPLRPRSSAGRESDQLSVPKVRKRLDGVLAAVATVFGSAEWQTEEAPEIVVDQKHPDIDAA